MEGKTPILYMFCGKICSGKTSLASQIEQLHATVRITEDEWLEVLFKNELLSVADYVRCSSKLKTAIYPHLVSVIKAGISIVLDFPANTLEQRAWMRKIIDATGARHELHVLQASDELCLARLAKRNEHRNHPFAVSEQQYHSFSAHFMPPLQEEMFNVILHNQCL